MGFFSGLASFFGDAAKAVVSGAKKTFSKAKEYAGKAIGWMAEKGESFIGTVKDMWSTVKPWIEKIVPWVEKAAEALPWPWLRVAALGVAKGLQALLMLENSPIMKKIEEALLWAIEAAKKLRETFFTQAEEEQAAQRQKDFEEAMGLMQTEEQKQSVRFAAIINDYLLIQTRIQKVLDNDRVTNFEHYLRLRATQKLLKEAEKTLQTAESLDEITADDLTLLQMGQKLLATNPEMDEFELNELNRIIARRFSGKTLIPFVFEEMIRAWEVKYQNMDGKWNRMNKELASTKNVIRKLEVTMKVQGLSSQEEKELSELKSIYTSSSYRKDILEKDTRAMKSYVHAAEGFLQFLEKTPEQLAEEGLDFMAHSVEEVGKIIIDCAQNSKPWDALTEDEKSLIIDYSNIFAEASKKRSESLVEIDL